MTHFRYLILSCLVLTLTSSCFADIFEIGMTPPAHEPQALFTNNGRRAVTVFIQHEGPSAPYWSIGPTPAPRYGSLPRIHMSTVHSFTVPSNESIFVFVDANGQKHSYRISTDL